MHRGATPRLPGTGVTAPSLGVRLVIKSFTTLRTGRRKREGTAVRSEPDRTIPAKQVTMVNVSKGALRRHQAEPAYPAKGSGTNRLAQKGLDSGACVPSDTSLYPIRNPPAERSSHLPSRQMDTRNGETQRTLSPPFPLIRGDRRGRAGRKPRQSRMPQEANAPGNAGDMLTWGG